MRAARAFVALPLAVLCACEAADDAPMRTPAASDAATLDAGDAGDAGGCTEELLARYDALVDGGRGLLAEPTAVFLYLAQHRELIEELGERCMPEVCARMHATFAWCLEDAIAYLRDAGYVDELDGGALLDAFCIDPPAECAPYR